MEVEEVCPATSPSKKQVKTWNPYKETTACSGFFNKFLRSVKTHLYLRKINKCSTGKEHSCMISSKLCVCVCVCVSAVAFQEMQQQHNDNDHDRRRR